MMQQAFQGSRGASYPRHYAWEIAYARVSERVQFCRDRVSPTSHARAA